jgi:hypothetical protein
MPIIEIATNFKFNGIDKLRLGLLKLEHDIETQSLDLKSNYDSRLTNFYYLIGNQQDSISSHLVDWDRVDEADENHSTLVFLPQAWSELKIVLMKLCEFDNAIVSFATYYQFGFDAICKEAITLEEFRRRHRARKLFFNQILYLKI